MPVLMGPSASGSDKAIDFLGRCVGYALGLSDHCGVEPSTKLNGVGRGENRGVEGVSSEQGSRCEDELSIPTLY